jgi:hypothetical protein
MVYYYIGLEARLRDNKYQDLDAAMAAAVYASRRIGYPLRIFKMNPNNKAELVRVISPDGKIKEVD